MNGGRRFSRRGLLRGALAASAAPWFVPARALGKDGAVAPSNQVTLGVIGYGNRCTVVLDHFMSFKEVRPLAVSDCRAQRREAGKKAVDAKYGNGDCKMHADFRELLARQDVQAVLIATGNRWHGLGSIMAARAGKDVYSEKPICLTLEEGRMLVNTMAATGAVYQAGHQRRSVDSYRFMVDCVHRQKIGKLQSIVAQQWTGPAIKPTPVQKPPEGLDWDMWLGQTPWHEFTPARFNNWQYFWDTAEGILTDMGCHYTDIAQWGNQSDRTGPETFEARGVFDPEACSDTPVTGECRARYASGVELIMKQQAGFNDRYIQFNGTEGWIRLDDATNVITASNPVILRDRRAGGKGWDDTGDHIGNFLRCIRTRQATISNPETAFRAQSICLLNTIAMRLGRKLEWSPAGETFTKDEDANRMKARPPRAPWRLA